MKNRLMTKVPVAMLLLFSAVFADDAQRQINVPLTLQGDWATKPKPSIIPGISSIPSKIRITDSNCIYRIPSESGRMVGAYDGNGITKPWATDSDGTKYLELAHYSISVRTNALPWQIDLWHKTKEGELIEVKGICEVQGDILKISLSTPGGDRPKTFDATTEATRIQKAK